jgi:hypothetical protein
MASSVAVPPALRNRQLIEVLLLVLRASPVTRVVDIGTLHYFIDSSFRDMLKGDELALDLLWSVLCNEPGIDRESLIPAFLALKSLEARLGVTVVLPAEIDEIPDDKRRDYLGQIAVSAAEVDHLLERIAQGSQPRKPPPHAAPAPRVGSQQRKAAEQAEPGDPAAILDLRPPAPLRAGQEAERAERRRVLMLSVLFGISLLLVVIFVLRGGLDMTQ